MTKQEFVDAVASRANLSRRDAGAAVDAVLDTVTDALKKRDTITFTGFGKFSTSERAAREGVNPAQSEPEGAHPGGDRAEVLGREPAEGRGQGRLAPRRSFEAREGRAGGRGLLFAVACEHMFA